MKKQIQHVVRIAILLIGVTISAQSQMFFGVETGPAYNRIVSTKDKDPNFKYGSRVGYSFGIPIQYHIPSVSKWFGGVTVSPTYISKNFSTTQIGFSENHIKYTNSHIDIPIIANFQYSIISMKNPEASFHILANIGFFNSFWVGGHIKGVKAISDNPYYTYDVDTKRSFNNTTDHRYQWGTLYGLGIKYSSNQKVFFTVETRLSRSNETIFKKQDTTHPLYHDTFTLLFGVQTAIQHLFGGGTQKSNELSIKKTNTPINRNVYRSEMQDTQPASPFFNQ